MNMLWDRALVKRLKDKVRKANPKDWKASRALRRAQRSPASVWLDRGKALLLGLGAGVMLCAAFLSDKQESLRLEPACGLTALNFLVLGLVAARSSFAGSAGPLSPLVNTPATGSLVYLHVLSVLRLQVVKRELVVLSLGIFATIFMRLIVWNELPAESWLPMVAAGMVITGSSQAFGALTGLLPDHFKKGVWAFSLTLLLIYAWQVLKVMFPGTPSPGFIGESAFFLPQARVFHWVATGGPFPLAAFLVCLAGLLLAVFLISDRLRDRGHSFPDEPLEEPPEIRAESFLVMASREWRAGLQEKERYDLDDPAEEEDEEGEAEGQGGREADDERTPLFVHAATPVEHNAPVTEEFRQIMAQRVRSLLDLSDKDFLAWTGPAGQAGGYDMRRARRRILYGGILLPVLSEAASWLPDGWPGKYAVWLTILAFVLPVLPLFSGWFTFSTSVCFTRSHWVKIPVDVEEFAGDFFAWQRSVFIGRCLLMAWVVPVIAMTALVIMGVHEVTGWNPSSPVVMDRLVYGTVSLPCFTFALFVAVIAMRYLETMSFFGDLFRGLRWRGAWRFFSKMYALLFLMAGGALMVAVIFVCFSAAIQWNGMPWHYVPLLLLSGELMHQATIKIAFYAAKWARADWQG